MNNKLTEVLRKIVLVLSVLVFIACAVYLVSVYYPNDKNPDMAIGNDLLFNDFDNQQKKFLDYVRDLKNENKEMYGYLSIKDTKINYPVMFIDNNDYYLTHNFYKKYDRHGALFIDCNTQVNQSQNLLIYGHSMLDGTMFGGLHKFKNKSHWEKHNSLVFATMEEVYVYDIFAVVYTEIYPSSSDKFRYHTFINIFSNDDFDTYVSNMKKLSSYNTNITPSYGDQLITLSTCIDAKSNRRLVIVARRQVASVLTDE